MAEDVRATVRQGAMSSFQIVAVLICMAINALDGFDVLAIAFTGPVISKDWMLRPEQLGDLFSAGLAGMVAGSLLLSPLADVVGRRAMVLLGLVIITAGMAAAGFARDLTELEIIRAFTGLGIGTLLSSINTIVVEYASAKRKDFAVSVMAIGYPIGATVGGTISVFLIAHYGWRSVFWFGAALSAILIPLAWARLPESIDFLLAKRKANALAKINALLARMNRPPISALPDKPAPGDEEAKSIFAVFDRAFFARTILIVSAYFLTMIPFYFVLNWTPKVLVDMGLDVSTGISGAVIMNGCGVVGGLLLGSVARRVGLRGMTSLFMILFGGAIVAFGFAGTDLTLLLALAGAIGFFMIGLISGLYAIIGAMYPARVRNTGTGLALGVGRIGAVVGPKLGGILIGAGYSRPEYTMILCAPLLIAALLVLRVPLLFGGARETAAAAEKAAA